MRISGLGSGIDMDSIIEQLMAIERRPIVLMQQRQTALEAQQNAWRDVNTRLKNLSDKFTALKLESTYLGRITEVSNESVIKASANPSAVMGTYEIEVIQLATGVVQHSAKVEKPVNEALGVEADSSITISLGGKEWKIAIDADDTLNSLVQKINSFKNGDDEAVPVTASVVDNRLVLTSKETGTGSQFNVGVSGNELRKLLLGEGYEFTEVVKAQDAIVKVNGIEIKSESNTLKDIIQGVTLELLEVDKTKLVISQDTQQAVDKLQEFVDQYNSLLDFINDKLQTEGTLRGDTTLMRLQSSLRSMVVSGVSDGKYRSLADIGIGTAKFVAGAADYSGKLTLDKAKLEEALKEDPLALKELLFSVTQMEGEDGEIVTEHTGILHNLENYIRNFTRAGDGILTEKDKSYDRQIKDLKDQVERMEQRLELRQERLVAQFVALEKALATMQSQGNWLSSQLSQISKMYGQSKSNR